MEKWNKQLCTELSVLYRRQLFEIMSEWAIHSPNRLHGGYYADFGENWVRVSDRKDIVSQARNTYMMAAMAGIDPDSAVKWIELAALGRDFLVKHAWAGGGRWYSALDSSGKEVLQGTIKYTPDSFCLMALCEYVNATGDKRDMALIEETYETFVHNLFDPYFRDIYPREWGPDVCYQNLNMHGVCTPGVVSLVLGLDRVRPFLRRNIDRLIEFFPNNKSGYSLECLKRDGSIIDTPEARSVSPGHVLEAMWFCTEQSFRMGDLNRDLPRILEIIDKTAIAGTDARGGIIHRFDCFGAPDDRVDTDLSITARGQRFDVKVEWVNCEALVALGCAAVFGGKEDQIERFLQHHDYCQKHFRPEEGGDWYHLLTPEGTPLPGFKKGGTHQSAFHVPRALWKLSELFAYAAKK